jgi:hypothetical protein
MQQKWLQDIQTLKLPPLLQGMHDRPEKGVCFMEMVAFMERLPHSDHPPCTGLTLCHIAQTCNDLISYQENRNRLIAFVPDFVGADVADKQATRWLSICAKKAKNLFDVLEHELDGITKTGATIYAFGLLAEGLSKICSMGFPEDSYINYLDRPKPSPVELDKQRWTTAMANFRNAAYAMQGLRKAEWPTATGLNLPHDLITVNLAEILKIESYDIGERMYQLIDSAMVDVMATIANELGAGGINYSKRVRDLAELAVRQAACGSGAGTGCDAETTTAAT